MTDCVKFTEPATLRYIDGAWRNDDGDPVDMVSVIRCRDCMHSEPFSSSEGREFVCRRHGINMLMEGKAFCA